jgi:hypothetical protein
MKQCSKCLKQKPYSDFHKKKAINDGYAYHCKACVREYDMKEHDPKRVLPRKQKDGLVHCRHCEQYLDRSNFWGKDLTYCRPCKKTVGINSNLKKKGLDMDSYSILEKSQSGVCAICKNPELNRKRLSVDHDHSCCPGENTCGKCNRGLLCFNCNVILGNAKDNIDILQAAIKYLQK